LKAKPGTDARNLFPVEPATGAISFLMLVAYVILLSEFRRELGNKISFFTNAFLPAKYSAIKTSAKNGTNSRGTVLLFGANGNDARFTFGRVIITTSGSTFSGDTC
jgi:hypothetical protein